MDCVSALRECELFAGLSECKLEKIARLCRQEALPAGTVIFGEGNHATHLYVVGEGKVALEMRPGLGGPSARQTTVEILPRGRMLGWSALVEPYIFTS